jgi:hypothetical protein
VTETPTPSPTPADIGFTYSYSVAQSTITLSWQATFASSVTIDGVSEPLAGRQTYPLRNHTFVLVATSLDHTQYRIQAVTMTLSQCSVRVNAQTFLLESKQCLNR